MSLPAALLDEVRRLPGSDNLSAVVSQALERWAADVRLGVMLDQLDHLCGPVPPDVQQRVDAEWRNL